jgi:hypothetical protein
VPDLVGKVAAEEAPHLFGPWVLAVEEPAWSEVVDLSAKRELLVGSEGLIRIVLEVAKALEDVLGRGAPQRD